MAPAAPVAPMTAAAAAATAVAAAGPQRQTRRAARASLDSTFTLPVEGHPWQHATCSLANVDLNSALADQVPQFDFLPPDQQPFPIVAYRVRQTRNIALFIKKWLLQTLMQPVNAGREGILRMETQDLHLLTNDYAPDEDDDSEDEEKEEQKRRETARSTDATLVHLDSTAFMRPYGSDLKSPASILALFVPHESHVRWWYTCIPLGFTTCLLALIHQRFYTPHLLDLRGELQPGNAEHARLFLFLREHFLAAIKPPHHPDYLAAQKLTDYSIPIRDPDTALARIYADDALYAEQVKPHFRPYEVLDLEGDRYLLALHPAEREIASLVRLQCSRYLLLKRRFFKAFWREMVAKWDRIGGQTRGRRRVRTEIAHEAWLEAEMGWRGGTERARRPTRSQRLLRAWAELGLLEERRYLGLVGKKGGWLEENAEGGWDAGIEEVGEEEDEEVEEVGRAAASKSNEGRGRRYGRVKAEEVRDEEDERVPNSLRSGLVRRNPEKARARGLGRRGRANG